MLFRSDMIIGSGQKRNFDFTIKNIDPDEKGAFGLVIDCEGLSTSINPSSVTLEPLASKLGSGSVTYSTMSKITKTCTIKASTKRPSDKKDSCTFKVTVNPKPRCDPGEKTCSDDRTQLGTCKLDGSDWEWVKCEQGCEYIGGSARCKGTICVKEGGECKIGRASCRERV